MNELGPGSVIAGMTVDRELGSGGMGVVYRAFDQQLGRYVAIKVVAEHLAADPQFRDRFEREARMAAEIDHPHAVGVYFAGKENERLFLVMRYVDGTDLGDFVKVSGGGLDPDVAVRLIAEVASALDAAHAKKLVHRDVKPANILIGWARGRPVAYLADFGLTRSLTGTSRLTATGGTSFTIEYAAPEVLDGKPATRASDVYSLGATLTEMLAGARFPRDAVIGEPHSTLTEVIADRAVAVALDGVLRTALDQAPERRYPMAGALARAALAALEAGATEPPTVMPGPAPATTLPPWPADQGPRAFAATIDDPRYARSVDATPPPPERAAPPPYEGGGKQAVGPPAAGRPSGPVPAFRQPPSGRSVGPALGIGAAVAAAIVIWVVVQNLLHGGGSTLGIVAVLVALTGVLLALGHVGYLVALGYAARKRGLMGRSAGDFVAGRQGVAGGVTVAALIGLVLTSLEGTVPEVFGLVIGGGAGVIAKLALDGTRAQFRGGR